jgi:steroid delta-isomerase-like uncharacterized protein
VSVDPDLRARREARIAEHVEAENQFDVDRVLATMAPEPKYDVKAYDVVVEGNANVREFLKGHFESLPGIVSKATRFYHDDEAVVVEVHVDGTHTGEIVGIPANGNTINVDSIGVFYFEPDGDIILGEQVWADMLKLTQQLNGEQPAAASA